MASTLATFRTKVKARLQDAAGKLSSDSLDAAIAGALAQFQGARPRELAELVTGTGGFDYALDGGTPKLSAWQDGLSAVLSIVYPWSASAQRPPVLDADEFMIARLASGLVLRFLDATPAATEQFLVTYTSSHVLTESTSSVATADEEALSDLGAAYACEALAGFYSQSIDPTLQVDSVERRGQADHYRAQAKRWRDAYAAKMGGGEASAPASGVAAVESVLGLDTASGGYFFHGRR